LDASRKERGSCHLEPGTYLLAGIELGVRSSAPAKAGGYIGCTAGGQGMVSLHKQSFCGEERERFAELPDVSISMPATVEPPAGNPVGRLLGVETLRSAGRSEHRQRYRPRTSQKRIGRPFE